MFRHNGHITVFWATDYFSDGPVTYTYPQSMVYDYLQNKERKPTDVLTFKII
jgi:hypothetical protein